MISSILLIDSDVAVLALLSSILSQNGFRPLRARTPDEALEIADREYVNIDLALCNRLFLEGDFAGRMNGARPGLRMLPVSAAGEDEVLRIGLAAGDGFDGKLIEAVTAALSTPQVFAAGRMNQG